MEEAYLTTPGPLEERLMAALEAADVPGADTRCIGCNKPAISAFVKVVRIGDGERARELSVDLAGRIEETQRAGWDIEGNAVAYLLLGRARIAAALDEREEAVQLLREGFRRTRHKGEYVRLAHRLPEFESLHDYLPYQQFLKPRG